jgi:ribosomal protein S18 acetylase RimI-like enzyme
MGNLFTPPRRASDRAQAVATITSAFAQDPVERWLYRDDTQYRQYFPEFADALGGDAFEQQTAWASSDGAAVALWLPPGVETDAASIVEILTNTVSADQHEEMFAVLGQMSAAHPSDPHWYLAWLAVDTSRQANGLGGDLLQQCLHAVDDTHLPAYLETPNPRTVDFYRRHGFEVVGRTHAGTCPPLTFMLRTAR